MLAKTHLAVALLVGLTDLQGAEEYVTDIRPLLEQYCQKCHSTVTRRGDLDLQRFASLEDVRENLGVWRKLITMLEDGEMPPEDNPQPSMVDRTRIVEWARALLVSEAEANSGDPGRVVLRRLSNAQYGYTVRDLTGWDLDPAREFPVDGAAGEGFTNAGEALVMSPGLLEKYFAAAKKISRHAVLLPDGIRFSQHTTRQDWTEEVLQQIQAFYGRYTEKKRREWMYGDVPLTTDFGQAPMEEYIRASLEYRQRSDTGSPGLEELAAKSGLSGKYLETLWNVLSGKLGGNSFLLNDLRTRWQSLTPENSDELVAEIRRWQRSLWKFNSVGHFNRWLEPALPLVTKQSFTIPIKAEAEGEKVVVYLFVGDAGDGNEGDFLVWKRPRFEGNPIPVPGDPPRPSDLPPILLRDLSIAITSHTPDGVDQIVFGQPLDSEPPDDASFVLQAPAIVEVPVPQRLVGERQFVVEVELGARVDGAGSVQAHVSLQKLESLAGIIPPIGAKDDHPEANAHPEAAKFPVIVRDGQRKKDFEDAFAAHREWLPPAMCYTQIVPVDEGITIVLFHREDGFLSRFILEEKEKQELDRLWHELRYISQDALKIHDSFDTWWNFGAHYGRFSRESREVPIRQRAERFREQLHGSESRHVDAALEFAQRAYRRPLSVGEKIELLEFYRSLRSLDVPHDEAIRKVLARVLVSPSFLYRIEEPAPDTDPQPVSSWELASRLSYFLWSSMPDANLRRVAARGTIKNPEVLTEQTKRMLRNTRVGALAIEFAAQWLGFREFDQHEGINEDRFPEFAALRWSMYEESLLFFEDMIRGDHSVIDLIDADHTFLNAKLASHYEVPDVTGSEHRRVEGLKKYGRGGVLGMATMLTKQSGASRTSPVLRGNWILETLLGNQLPKPPPNVPQLPDDETDTDGLTVRQLVEKHRSVHECAVCHDKIDPLGFALEGFDPLGRRRDRDLAGRPIEVRAVVSDGPEQVEFEGIDGLRKYLLEHRREELLNNFCRKLLGYALGRAVELSDGALLREMREELEKNGYRFSSAVITIVSSKQFQCHRGRDVVEKQ